MLCFHISCDGCSSHSSHCCWVEAIPLMRPHVTQLLKTRHGLLSTLGFSDLNFRISKFSCSPLLFLAWQKQGIGKWGSQERKLGGQESKDSPGSSRSVGSKPDRHLARKIPSVLASAPHLQCDIRYIQWVSNFLGPKLPPLKETRCCSSIKVLIKFYNFKTKMNICLHLQRPKR